MDGSNRKSNNKKNVDEVPSDPVLSSYPLDLDDDGFLNFPTNTTSLDTNESENAPCFDILTGPSGRIPSDDDPFGLNFIPNDPFGLEEEYNVADNSDSLLVPRNPILSHEDTEEAEPASENVRIDPSELSEPPLKRLRNSENGNDVDLEDASNEQLPPKEGLSEDNAEETLNDSSEENEVDDRPPDTERPPSAINEEDEFSDKEDSEPNDSEYEFSQKEELNSESDISVEEEEDEEEIPEKVSILKKELDEEITRAIDGPPENVAESSNRLANLLGATSLAGCSNFQRLKSSLANFNVDEFEDENELAKAKATKEQSESDDDDDEDLSKKLSRTLARIDRITGYLNVSKKMIKDESAEHKEWAENFERGLKKAEKDFTYKDYELKTALWDHHCSNIKTLSTNQLIAKFNEANLWEEITAIKEGKIPTHFRSEYEKASTFNKDFIGISEPFSSHFQNVLTKLIRNRMYAGKDVIGKLAYYITGVLVPEGMLRLFALVNNISIEFSFLQLLKRDSYYDSLPDDMKTKASRLLEGRTSTSDASSETEGVVKTSTPVPTVHSSAILHDKQEVKEASDSFDLDLLDL